MGFLDSPRSQSDSEAGLEAGAWERQGDRPPGFPRRVRAPGRTSTPGHWEHWAVREGQVPETLKEKRQVKQL